MESARWGPNRKIRYALQGAFLGALGSNPPGSGSVWTPCDMMSFWVLLNRKTSAVGSKPVNRYFELETQLAICFGFGGGGVPGQQRVYLPRKCCRGGCICGLLLSLVLTRRPSELRATSINQTLNINKTGWRNPPHTTQSTALELRPLSSLAGLCFSSRLHVLVLVSGVLSIWCVVYVCVVVGSLGTW